MRCAHVDLQTNSKQQTKIITLYRRLLYSHWQYGSPSCVLQRAKEQYDYDLPVLCRRQRIFSSTRHMLEASCMALQNNSSPHRKPKKLRKCRKLRDSSWNQVIALGSSLYRFPWFPQHFSTYDLSSKSAEQVDTSGITSPHDHLFLDMLRNHANRYSELPISITLSQIRFCDP